MAKLSIVKNSEAFDCESVGLFFDGKLSDGGCHLLFITGPEVKEFYVGKTYGDYDYFKADFPAALKKFSEWSGLDLKDPEVKAKIKEFMDLVFETEYAEALKK
jgi:hypothetical protein